MKEIIDSILNTKEAGADEEQRSADFEHAGNIARTHGRVSALNYLANEGYVRFSGSDKFDYRVGLTSEGSKDNK